MFDIGFTELLLVALVALVVLGPERLPGAVRTAGLWIGRIKRSFNSIKAEVEREIGADEIRRQLHNEHILELEREMKAMKQDILTPSAKSEPTPESTQTTAPPPATAEATTATAASQDKTAQP
ncbi:preprotein translocase subunit TatA [Pseudomonas taeanensis MS-3]|uniref:Sec-independent protein translocase protein TatB n=1 Tax=Pseudomonas taeanensis MS-3 TaxID=1395571 RepID=A0A0A1YN63_9PSED|nr:Sec-independent protein translocase protein TatB [Pseudomonas taeanensis]KFX71340.1 preprotein translocase subunit TatA [Pseudomonas taeanensis MS-3]